MSLHPINIYQVGPPAKKVGYFNHLISILCRKFSTFSSSPSIVWLIESTGTHYLVCLERALSVSLSPAASLWRSFESISERASRRIDAIAVARLNLATCITRPLSLSLYLFAIQTFRWEIVLEQIRIEEIRIERRLANISFHSIQRP